MLSDAEVDVARGTNYDNTVPTTAAADNNADLRINHGFLAGQYRVEFEPGNSLTITNIDRLTTVIEQVYDQGYDNGYDDGYEDGYRDGFRDGVASTQ